MDVFCLGTNIWCGVKKIGVYYKLHTPELCLKFVSPYLIIFWSGITARCKLPKLSWILCLQMFPLYGLIFLQHRIVSYAASRRLWNLSFYRDKIELYLKKNNFLLNKK